MEHEVVVKGIGRAGSMPDRAVIEVLVEADGDTREQAYSEAAASAGQVDQVLSARAGSLDRVTNAVLVVHPKSRLKKGEAVRSGWRARRSSTVEVTDIAQLGELISELIGASGAVSGPEWRLDDGNPAHRKARRLAAEDARRRAEDYAAALGLRIGEVAWVSEPGLRGRGRGTGGGGGIGGAPLFAAASGAETSSGFDDVIDVDPEEITTDAALEVGFRLDV